MAAMEILMVNEEIQQMVIERKSTHDIQIVSQKYGMKNLFENAMELFYSGQTTLEEVLRVTTFEE